MRRLTGALAALALLAGCSHRPSAPQLAATPHYEIGAPYRLGGTWSYPRESFGYDATGLGERMPDTSGLAADGERWDPDAMLGAHRTLQLPAIARITDLDTGRQILVRLVDRGPARPGRIVGLSRRAADLLGLPAQGPARVRVQVENAPSQALRDTLQGRPAGITAAPVAAVTAEALPMPGARAIPTRPLVIPGSTEAGGDSRAAALAPLPATVVEGAPQPGQLWLEAGAFSQRRYADAVAARLSGLPVDIERDGGGRDSRYVVRAGPFASAEAADTALDRAQSAGVTDAAIVVR